MGGRGVGLALEPRKASVPLAAHKHFLASSESLSCSSLGPLSRCCRRCGCSRRRCGRPGRRKRCGRSRGRSSRNWPCAPSGRSRDRLTTACKNNLSFARLACKRQAPLGLWAILGIVRPSTVEATSCPQGPARLLIHQRRQGRQSGVILRPPPYRAQAFHAFSLPPCLLHA